MNLVGFEHLGFEFRNCLGFSVCNLEFNYESY